MALVRVNCLFNTSLIWLIPSIPYPYYKANKYFVFLGAPRRHRPSWNTGTKRTTWFVGKWKMNGRLVTQCSISANALNSQTAHIPWQNNQWSIRCSNILYIHSHYHAFALQGMEGALGPIGIIGPSGQPVRTSYLILSAKLYVTSAFWKWWSDPLSPISPSGAPGWQRKSGGDGAWRRFDESFSVCTVSTE